MAKNVAPSNAIKLDQSNRVTISAELMKTAEINEGQLFFASYDEVNKVIVLAPIDLVPRNAVVAQ